MIPHRMLSNESCGNGLKGRVTACRKRLRVNRVAQKIQANDEPKELYRANGASSPLQEIAHSLRSPVMPLSASMNYSSSFAEPESGIRTTSAVSEQEVGIT